MAALTDTQLREAELLVARLESDEVQNRLRPGFERDFSNSVLEQWSDRKWLSFEGRNGKRSQIAIIQEIVERCEERNDSKDSRRPTGRRYEGFRG